MKNMRSEVCKRANTLIKTGYYTKSSAFKKAWAEVKKAARCIKGSDLAAGAVIRIEYGREGNFVDCTVLKVSSELRYGAYAVKAVANRSGNELDFCVEPDELIEKAA